MKYAQKKSLLLPLFLIAGPTILLFLAIVLFDNTNIETTYSTGDAYVDYMNSRRDEYIYDNLSFPEKIAKTFENIADKPLSAMASFSFLAIVPCAILGVIMLIKQKSIKP